MPNQGTMIHGKLSFGIVPQFLTESQTQHLTFSATTLCCDFSMTDSLMLSCFCHFQTAPWLLDTAPGYEL